MSAIAEPRPTAATPLPASRPAAPSRPAAREVDALKALPGKISLPKPGDAPPARDSLQERLQKVAGPPEKPLGEPQKPAEKPERPGADETPENEQDAPETPPAKPEGENVPRGTTPDKPVDKRKNPWKLYEEEKRLRAAAESEAQRLRSAIVPEQERTQMTERLTKAEARAKELEDGIRFVDYQKSSEFQTKYEQPYVNAWSTAMKRLSEIPVADETAPGGKRPVNQQDILTLVNLPLGEAQEVAEEVFGKFAGVAMAHREKIKDLFEARQEALTDAEKNGASRVAETTQRQQAQLKEVTDFVDKTARELQEAILKDPENGEFFTMKTVKEGETLSPEDKEWNDFLEKGYQLVDEAFKNDPRAPNLTPEQRKERLARFVALRNRAAAFGPLKRLVKRLRAQLKEKDKDLTEYAESTPGAGGSQPAARGGYIPPRDSLEARLKSRAGR